MGGSKREMNSYLQNTFWDRWLLTTFSFYHSWGARCSKISKKLQIGEVGLFASKANINIFKWSGHSRTTTKMATEFWEGATACHIWRHLLIFLKYLWIFGLHSGLWMEIFFTKVVQKVIMNNFYFIFSFYFVFSLNR